MIGSGKNRRENLVAIDFSAANHIWYALSTAI